MALDEFAIIERYFSKMGQANLGPDELGVGDDAAIVSTRADCQLLISTDTLIAGVHFPQDAPADSVGHKSLAVNLSDMAAMGAQPKGFTLAISSPGADEAWWYDFSQGMQALAERYALALVGGDTTKTPGPLTVSITIFGEAPSGQALRRSGACVGDAVMVTGSLGEAAWSLQQWQQGLLRHETAESLRQQHRSFYYPEPRVEFARQLRGLASSAIDISDGLIADAAHLCEQSGVGIVLDYQAIPLSSRLSSQDDELAFMGDDYELCFTCPVDAVGSVHERAAALGLQVSQIGSVVLGSEVSVEHFDLQLRDISRLAYRHFESK